MDSYLNKKLRNSMHRAYDINQAIVSRGMAGNLGLQARGQNQLMKEMNECGKDFDRLRLKNGE